MTIKSLTLQSMSDNDLTWISTSQEHNYNVWPKDVKILLVRGSLVVCFQLCSNSLLFQHEKVYLVWCWRAVTSTPRTTFMNWIADCEFLSSNSPASDSAYLSSTSLPIVGVAESQDCRQSATTRWTSSETCGRCHGYYIHVLYSLCLDLTDGQQSPTL